MRLWLLWRNVCVHNEFAGFVSGQSWSDVGICPQRKERWCKTVAFYTHRKSGWIRLHFYRLSQLECCSAYAAVCILWRIWFSGTVLRVLRRKWSPGQILCWHTILVLLILAPMIGYMISGISLSEYEFDFVSIRSGQSCARIAYLMFLFVSEEPVSIFTFEEPLVS